jgi:hypothetical protein
VRASSWHTALSRQFWDVWAIKCLMAIWAQVHMSKGALAALLFGDNGGLFGVHVVGVRHDGEFAFTLSSASSNLPQQPLGGGHFFRRRLPRRLIKHFVKADLVDHERHAFSPLPQAVHYTIIGIGLSVDAVIIWSEAGVVNANLPDRKE